MCEPAGSMRFFESRKATYPAFVERQAERPRCLARRGRDSSKATVGGYGLATSRFGAIPPRPGTSTGLQGNARPQLLVFSVVQEMEFMMGCMTVGKPVPVFANMDFWTQVVEQHPEFFARLGRLQEAVRSIVDPAYEGLDGGQQMQMNMLMLTAIGVAEIVTLVGNGMGHGAMKIVRGVMENAINMGYMRQFPDQAEKYLECQWVEQYKLHKHLEESSPAMYAEIPQEKRDSDEAEYQRVRPLFQYQVQTSTGGMKTKMQDGWCREDLFHRAERVGLAQSYRTVMPSANQILHGTISGWIRDLDEVTRRIEYPPAH